MRGPVHVADVIVGQASKQIHQVLRDNIRQAINGVTAGHMKDLKKKVQDEMKIISACGAESANTLTAFQSSQSGHVGKSVNPNYSVLLLGMWKINHSFSSRNMLYGNTRGGIFINFTFV